MNEHNVQALLQHLIGDNLQVSACDEGFIVQLPFNDYEGDPIEMFITPMNGQLILDDMGHSAGLLFDLAQHGEEAPGHQLVKSLADAWGITMNYDTGVLLKEISLEADEFSILEFIKVLISLQTAIPEMRRRKEIRGRKRLAAKVWRDIKQLRLPIEVQKQVEVAGKHDMWTVDGRYVRGDNSARVEILIATAGLGGQNPRAKVEHVLTLAHDVLDVATRRELRIIYDLDGATASAQRSAAMIKDYQDRIGYRAFNYADKTDKAELFSITIQDSRPLALDR